MNQAQQTARVGLFFLLGLALTWVTFETLSGGKLFRKDGYTLVAGFDSLKSLKAGDEVRMAGVKIGTVESTRLNPAKRRGEAVLRIQKEIPIPDDAVATIAMSGIIGTNYLAVDLGTDACLDGVVPRTQPGERERVSDDDGARLDHAVDADLRRGDLRRLRETDERAVDGSGSRELDRHRIAARGSGCEHSVAAVGRVRVKRVGAAREVVDLERAVDVGHRRRHLGRAAAVTDRLDHTDDFVAGHEG